MSGNSRRIPIKSTITECLIELNATLSRSSSCFGAHLKLPTMNKQNILRQALRK